jgi:hypothetical protein
MSDFFNHDPMTASNRIGGPGSRAGETPIVISGIEWNIGGLASARSSDKIATLVFLIGQMKPSIITLQETHLTRNTEDILKAHIPGYKWTFNHGTSASRGVAIGIRGNLTPLIGTPTRNPEGTFLRVRYEHKDTPIDIFSVYFQPNNKTRDFNHYKNLIHRNSTPKIVGGDFNTDPADNLFKEIEEINHRKKIKFIENPFPSIAEGKRVIDHVGMSLSILEAKKPYIYSYPSTTRDHNPLIFSTRNELKSKGHDPIPPHIAGHPNFIESCRNKIPPNVFGRDQGETEEPETPEVNRMTSTVEFLSALEKAARETFKEWKENKQSMGFEKETVNRLWAARRLQKMMRNRNKIPTKTFKCPLHQEIYEKHRHTPDFTDMNDNMYRKKAKREYIREVGNEVAEAKKHVGFPVNLPKTLITDTDNPYLEKNFMSNNLSIVNPTNNLPCRDPNRTAEVLGDFWKGIFSVIRPSDRSATETLLENYPKGEKQPEPGFNSKVFEEIINKNNATGSGPNGVPFAYYKVMHTHYPKFWEKLIEEVVEGTFIPEANFTECRLVLLPKEEGTIEAMETRPIAITNAAYRILMKYFAKQFRDFLSKIISPSQRALLNDRFIDDCLDDVINGVQQMKWDGKKPFIIQTDYRKAYDFINREEIKFMLEKIGAPNSLINIANIALEPSPTRIHINGAKPIDFMAVTGVKQGCPISPLLYIMVFDLLVANLPNCENFFTRAYMDDIAIIMENYKQLEDLTEVFDLYNRAVGASINYGKTKLICQEVNETLPPAPWHKVERVIEGKYLGVLFNQDTNDKRNWDRRTKKMGKAATYVRNGVNATNATIKKRLTFINTYILSHIPYLGRFTIIPKNAIGGIIKQIRKGLGGKNTIPNTALFSPAPPLNLKPAILHPVILNLACLAGKRPPMVEITQNENLAEGTVEWKRRWAINAYYRIIGLEESYENGAESFFRLRNKYNEWKERIKKPTHWLYMQMIARYPAHNFIEATYDQGPHAYHFLIHNCTHKMKSGLKHNLILHLLGSWNHNARTSKFIEGLSKFCRLGCGEVETHHHLLECQVTREMITHLKVIFVVLKQRLPNLGGYTFPENNKDMLLMSKPRRKEQVTLNLTLLATVRFVITALGYDKNLNPKAIGEHKWKDMLGKLPKIKTRNRPQTPQTTGANHDPRPEYTETSRYHGFFDGSGDLGNLKAGTGSIVLKDGIEVNAKSRTSGLLTSNGGEGYGPYDCKKLAIKEGMRVFHLLGDSKLIIELESGKATSNNITIIQLHIMSRQLNKEFVKITWQLIPRDLNGRTDRIADAAMISKERGEYFERNKDDMSRPRGSKTKPSIRDIEKTLTYKQHKIILPRGLVTYPISPSLRPTKITQGNRKKLSYELKKLTSDKEKKWLKWSILYEGHYRYEEMKANQERRRQQCEQTTAGGTPGGATQAAQEEEAPSPEQEEEPQNHNQEEEAQNQEPEEEQPNEVENTPQTEQHQVEPSREEPPPTTTREAGRGEGGSEGSSKGEERNQTNKNRNEAPRRSTRSTRSPARRVGAALWESERLSGETRRRENEEARNREEEEVIRRTPEEEPAQPGQGETAQSPEQEDEPQSPERVEEEHQKQGQEEDQHYNEKSTTPQIEQHPSEPNRKEPQTSPEGGKGREEPEKGDTSGSEEGSQPNDSRREAETETPRRSTRRTRNQTRREEMFQWGSGRLSGETRNRENDEVSNREGKKLKRTGQVNVTEPEGGEEDHGTRRSTRSTRNQKSRGEMYQWETRSPRKRDRETEEDEDKGNKEKKRRITEEEKKGPSSENESTRRKNANEPLKNNHKT